MGRDKKVIVHEKGKNRIFDSILDATEYFQEIADETSRYDYIQRIIEGTGVLQYHVNGKVHEVIIDYLFDEKSLDKNILRCSSRIKGKGEIE